MSECWLVIETSGRVGQVGVARSGAVVQSLELDATRRHARDLAASVERLLHGEGVTPRELSGVMVSIGPGGYTGLRVGVMSAKAMAYATGCALVAVPTFHAIAVQAPVEARRVWVIADALQGKIYLQQYKRSEGVLAPVGELIIDHADEWLPWMAKDVWVTGPGVVVHGQRNPDANKVPEPDRVPRIESVFRVGQRFPPLTRDEMFQLEPLYLRGSSAEEKAKKEGRGP